MAAFSAVFRTSIASDREVVGEVISGVVEDPTGMKAGEKFVFFWGGAKFGQTIVEIYDCLTL